MGSLAFIFPLLIFGILFLALANIWSMIKELWIVGAICGGLIILILMYNILFL